MGLKGGGARFDGASLPATMVFAEDMRIVGQQGFEYSRVQSRVAVSRRNRRPQVCLRLPPLTLPGTQCGSLGEEFDPVHRDCIPRGGDDGENTVQSPAGFAISPVSDIEYR